MSAPDEGHRQKSARIGYGALLISVAVFLSGGIVGYIASGKVIGGIAGATGAAILGLVIAGFAGLIAMQFQARKDDAKRDKKGRGTPN